MTEARFDELIHPSTRLSIVALLAAADWADFTFVRDRLELSDSALSKQLSTLEDAGYVEIDRPGRDRPRGARSWAPWRSRRDGLGRRGRHVRRGARPRVARPGGPRRLGRAAAPPPA